MGGKVTQSLLVRQEEDRASEHHYTAPWRLSAINRYATQTKRAAGLQVIAAEAPSWACYNKRLVGTERAGAVNQRAQCSAAGWERFAEREKHRMIKEDGRYLIFYRFPRRPVEARLAGGAPVRRKHKHAEGKPARVGEEPCPS